MLHSNCSICRPPDTSFRTRPIGSLDTLARMLQLSVAELEDICRNADRLYRIGKRERKDDGTVRVCYDALPALKSVQARIQCLILNKVEFPVYLQGGIKDPAMPRGQAANARLHLHQRTLVTVDIAQFFPSVRRWVVFDIWHRFFRCPPAVAECLTVLTTRSGSLPQGAKTSSLLANLVFWEKEWRLVAEFHTRGISYTRLTDDITCSSSTDLSCEQITNVISAVRALCLSKGLRLKRAKQTIARAGDRMITTKLVVGSKTSLPKEKRSSIRAAVAAVVRTPAHERNTLSYQKKYRRTSGQVSYLKQHHPTEAVQLRSHLRGPQQDD